MGAAAHLVDKADPPASVGTAANPLYTLPGTGTVSPAASLTAAPAVTAGAYTTGQVVGGLISLTGAPTSGTIQTVLCYVKTALTAPYDVYFFDTNPTNSTFTDNSALALNIADLPFCCGVAHCNDAITNGTPEYLQASGVGMPYTLATGTTLYAVVVMRGGQTFASTSAFGLVVKIIK